MVSAERNSMNTTPWLKCFSAYSSTLFPSQWVKSGLEGLKHHQPEDDRYPDATDYAER